MASTRWPIFQRSESGLMDERRSRLTDAIVSNSAPQRRRCAGDDPIHGYVVRLREDRRNQCVRVPYAYHQWGRVEAGQGSIEKSSTVAEAEISDRLAWVCGYAANVGATSDNVIVGVVVALLAIWSGSATLAEHKHPPMTPGQSRGYAREPPVVSGAIVVPPTVEFQVGGL